MIFKEDITLLSCFHLTKELQNILKEKAELKKENYALIVGDFNTPNSLVERTNIWEASKHNRRLTTPSTH